MQGIWLRLRGLYCRAEERGQTMAEYALILVLIALAVIVALGAVGGQLSALYNFIDEGIAGAIG